MLKRNVFIIGTAFLFLYTQSGCFQTSSTAPIVHPTKLIVAFSAGPDGSPMDPAPNEVVNVTIDGVLEGGTATAVQQFYTSIDTGTHTITTKSTIVNSTYTITHNFPQGEQFTFSFNCGDAHVTFTADPAWIAVTNKILILTKGALGAITLLPGETSPKIDVQAGSAITIGDQNGKTLKTMTLNVPYDCTCPFLISYP